MEYSRKGLQLTEDFEGCRLLAYQDVAGYWTIGFGHRVGVKQGDSGTSEQAEALLVADIAWAVAFVNHVVKVPIAQGIFDSLVDFTYNLGSGNLQSSTLLKLVNDSNFKAAAEEFERWDLAGGKVVAGLLRRRQAEETEFKS